MPTSLISPLSLSPDLRRSSTCCPFWRSRTVAGLSSAVKPILSAAKAEVPKSAPVSQSAAAPKPQAAPQHAADERIFASPLAKRLAKEASIDLSRIQGSGPHSRIIARDIEAESRIAWSDRRVGMGLQFEKVEPVDQAAIDEFVDQHFFTNRKA